eukprot:6675478-Pyramimonas_sp.AAC.1
MHFPARCTAPRHVRRRLRKATYEPSLHELVTHLRLRPAGGGGWHACHSETTQAPNLPHQPERHSARGMWPVRAS